MDKGSSNTPNIPNPPSFRQGYQQGTNLYLNFLDRFLNREQNSRNTQDPQRVAEQQSLQSRFGPTQYTQMLDALRQVDPTGYNLRQQTGNAISGDLAAGYGFAPGQQDQLEQQLRRTEAARGNTYGQAPVQAEAFAMGDRANQMHQQRIGNAIQFQNSATPESWMQAIPPVSADRSMAYVNPNAGFLGVNASNAAYQNTLGAATAGMPQQGSSPWGSILGTAATVAPAIISAFSDPRLKSNIEKIGRANGHNVYKYDIQEPKRTEIGVMADEVAAKRPDAVTRDAASGYLKVMYPKLGLPMPVQVEA